MRLSTLPAIGSDGASTTSRAGGASAGSDGRSSDSDGGSRLGRAARTVALGVLAGALAYLAVRRRRSLDVDSVGEESRDVADDLLPDDVEIGENLPSDGAVLGDEFLPDEVREPGVDGEAEELEPEESEPERGEEGERESHDTEPTDVVEELPGEDRSAEELAELAEENLQETPAEPGEMTVEDDVVDEVTGDGKVDELLDEDAVDDETEEDGREDERE